jgi:hypothetical protein
MTLTGHFEFRAPFIVNHRINRLVFHLDAKSVSDILLNLNITVKTLGFLKFSA